MWVHIVTIDRAGSAAFKPWTITAVGYLCMCPCLGNVGLEYWNITRIKEGGDKVEDTKTT